MPDHQSPVPVFDDPSGRRRRALRLITTATAIVALSYLSLVLLAVFGAPFPPASQVPLPPRLGSDAVVDSAPSATTDAPVPQTTPADALPSPRAKGSSDNQAASTHP